MLQLLLIHYFSFLRLGKIFYNSISHQTSLASELTVCNVWMSTHTILRYAALNRFIKWEENTCIPPIKAALRANIMSVKNGYDHS